jgi:2-iminobutanoate/2-iminopropanoate deaminase
MTAEPLPTPSAHAVGPYSPALRAGDWIVISGQVGIDPATGKLVDGGVDAQARQALANLTAILGDCGCGWEHVAKVTVFVATDGPQSMRAVNAVYSEIVGDCRPARSTVGVAWLPMEAKFEIEAWVHKPLNRPEA